MRDTTAAKNLLYRRLRCLADYEAANRALEKARAKNKDVHAVSFAGRHLHFIALDKRATLSLFYKIPIETRNNPHDFCVFFFTFLYFVVLF